LSQQLIAVHSDIGTETEALANVFKVGDDRLCAAHKCAVLLNAALNFGGRVAFG
jgi:hypothetical protein